MSFDLEDVVGYALADALRRGALIFGCLLGAPLLTSFGLAAANAVGNLSLRWFGEAVWNGWLWALVISVTSMWGALYISTALAVIFFLAKAEAVTAKAFVILLSLLCLLILLAFDRIDSETLGAILIMTGLLGSFLWLAKWWDQKRIVAGEVHLIGVAIENERRRIELREIHGTDIADGEFASAENSPDLDER